MSHTDRYGNTIDFDLGGGPDSWVTLRIRITADGEQDAVVELPLIDAVQVLTEGAAEAADALAAQKPLPDPLAAGGEVTHIMHTVEGVSFGMPQDAGIVWETRKGWQLRWVPEQKTWRVSRPSSRHQMMQMGDWARILGPEHYPMLGITVDVAPKVIHDGELAKLPQNPAYVYRTNRGLIIEWDQGRGQFIVSPQGANVPPEQVEYWPPERLAAGLAPNQFPIRRYHR